jgi:hypothetical protein
MKNELTSAQADLLYGMLTQRLYLRDDDPERDLVSETRDQLYPLTTAAAETAEARETIARMVRANLPLDYAAENAAKEEGTVVFLGGTGEIFAHAGPGLSPVKWDGVTGSWYEVEYRTLGGGNPHTLDGYYRKEGV